MCAFYWDFGGIRITFECSETSFNLQKPIVSTETFVYSFVSRKSFFFAKDPFFVPVLAVSLYSQLIKAGLVFVVVNYMI